MMDADILDMLEDIGRSSVARLSPGVQIPGETAQARRVEVLRAIRGTVLPRRLEFTASNGDCLAIEVNSSRVTDVFRVCSGALPDFETEPREELTGKLARLVSDIATAPVPLELMSLRPDTALEADDVGITLSEIEAACAEIDLPADPIVSVVSDNVETPEDVAPAETEIPDAGTLAAKFFDGAERFALGRVLTDSKGGVALQVDGACAQSQPLYTDEDLLARFARDLTGWNGDAAALLGHPQLIVMRPSGGKGAGLAILHDGDQTAMAVHEARKLGAVVNLWTSLRGAEE